MQRLTHDMKFKTPGLKRSASEVVCAEYFGKSGQDFRYVLA